jgi:hypothetical protein
VVEVGVLAAGWAAAIEGLQHGLHQLSLGGEQLLQVSIVVVDDVVVVVVGVAVAGLAILEAVAHSGVPAHQ